MSEPRDSQSCGHGTILRIIAERRGIEVKKGFGVLTAKTENLPPPANSKTSYIVVLSAIMTLKKMTEPV